MSLEEVSNVNLVRWYAEELAQGTMKNISLGSRKQLRLHGILRGGRGRFVLTEYGERLLKEMKKIEETKENTETQPEGNLGAVNRMGGEQG